MNSRFDSGPPLRWLVALAAAAALVAALLFSSKIHISMIDHGHDWWRLFVWQLVCWGFWAAVSPPVLRAGSRLLRPHDRPPLWTARLALMAATTVGGQILAGATAFWLLQPYVPVATYSFGQSLSRILDACSCPWRRRSPSLPAGPIVFAILLAMGYGLSGFWSARRRELRASRLEAELARAELDALRLEIQPHFLFNTLNSIAAQVRRGASDQALEMIVGLSELLRSTLEHDGTPVERYLDLQKARFGERLEVGIEVAADCARASVPFLLLQPLIENALSHGLGGRARGGRLEVRAARHGDELRLDVLDDGAGLPTGFSLDAHARIGLGNTRSKLARMIPEDRGALEVRTRPGGGTVASVTLPWERVPEAADPASAA